MTGWGSGASRDRTGDLLNAIQALSQLSYSPETTGRLGDGSGGRLIARPGFPRQSPSLQGATPPSVSDRANFERLSFAFTCFAWAWSTFFLIRTCIA
jgi:hypothetical protein